MGDKIIKEIERSIIKRRQESHPMYRLLRECYDGSMREGKLDVARNWGFLIQMFRGIDLGKKVLQSEVKMIKELRGYR